jgi:hypothetical protein
MRKLFSSGELVGRIANHCSKITDQKDDPVALVFWIDLIFGEE